MRLARSDLEAFGIQNRVDARGHVRRVAHELQVTGQLLGGVDRVVREDQRARRPTTLELAELSGIGSHYERRGFAAPWRAVREDPLTEGVGEVGEWRAVPFEQGANTYGYLVHPVQPRDAEVLVEVEHERCPYDGMVYARQGEIAGASRC